MCRIITYFLHTFQSGSVCVVTISRTLPQVDLGTCGPYVHLIIHNDVMLWIWRPHNISTSHILLTASGWRRGRRVYFLPILLQRLRCCAFRGYFADLGCTWWLFQWPLTFDINIFLSTQRLLTGDFLSYLNHSVQTLELVVVWWKKNLN